MADVDNVQAAGCRRADGLRKGYTTGSCAAASAKAATIALCTQESVGSVEIVLPAGQRARFDVVHCSFDSSRALCSVIKDAGDDPDATHGAEIRAEVRWNHEPGVAIEGGEGVGVVTKPGLGLPVGAPAINPVPRKMITSSVEEARCKGGRNEGVKVTISVPRGVEIARKTLNARLGIVGGISILGTTGIVTPFSTGAYKACIVQAIDVALANGCDHVVLTTGGRSEKFAQELLSLAEEAYIQMGDFVGFALKQCARKGVRKVTVAGMVGKLSKMAAGHAQTHVDHSRIDMSFLAQLAADDGLPDEVVAAIRDGNTARHFLDIVCDRGGEAIFGRICALAAAKCREQADGNLDVECIMTDFSGVVIGRAAAIG
ncbi:MAG: cobalt-precorrin-5B (C(1))-methyltransferase [Chloroflexi bacterium]|nr:cobalt-precorrin-5B (C(1))-methyltransferase [Chloroflexota bacterium]MDA8188130.1 cobalt-precorrin-5B (C(1))-methyltransferase [Dehalococcoidales bacterium]